MKPPYDIAVRDAVRLRMSPLNRESVTEIARDTGIMTQTLLSWRIQWQKQSQLVPATTTPQEHWRAVDKLAAVIQARGLSGSELGSICRERGITECSPLQEKQGGRCSAMLGEPPKR